MAARLIGLCVPEGILQRELGFVLNVFAGFSIMGMMNNCGCLTPFPNSVWVTYVLPFFLSATIFFLLLLLPRLHYPKNPPSKFKPNKAKEVHYDFGLGLAYAHFD